jgi:hypothetical protein
MFFEGAAGSAMPGTLPSATFEPCAFTTLAANKWKATRRVKLMRDNVNSPLSLNELEPGPHALKARARERSYLREEIRSRVWINGWAAAGTGILLFRICLLLTSLPYNSRLASLSSVTASPARSRPPKTPRDRE